MRPLVLLLLPTLLTACADKVDDTGTSPGPGDEQTDDTGEDENAGGDDSSAPIDTDAGADADGDGYTTDEDCDDTNADINPGAEEFCDGIDNNCDDLIDDDAVDQTTFWADTDEDGEGDAAAALDACELPDGHARNSTDCDDTDAALNTADADADGYSTCDGDCDDAVVGGDAATPGADETCDGIDNDCDEAVDEEATDATTWYADDDEDGEGDASDELSACEQPDGYTLNNTDCDDSDADVFPGADELCNGGDDDCDGDIDEDADDVSTFYADADEDGFGDPSAALESCVVPDGYTDDDADCDDGDGAINPGAEEFCDGIDNNCDDLIDDDAVDQATWYADNDEDGFGDASNAREACEQPDGYTINNTDCDDSDADVFPSADELCNGGDDDCDDAIDEDAADEAIWYVDSDGDGYGDPRDSAEACEQPDGYTSVSSGSFDCDDADSAVSPAAEELACDAVDNDCDGTIDTNTVPTAYATLQEAVDDLDDGAEICVEPGTYTEQLDLSGRTLSLTGQQGAASTTLDVGTTAPMIAIVGESSTFEAGDISISGFTITGDELSADGEDLLGGFAYVEGGTLRLEDLAFSELTGTMANGGGLEGLLVYGVDASLHIQDVTVDDVALGFRGESGDNSERLAGGLFRAVRGQLELDNVTVTNLAVTGDEDRTECFAIGTVLALDDNGSLGADVTDYEGTTFSITALEVRDSSISLHCGERAYGGGLVHFEDTDGELAGFVVTGLEIEVSSSAYGSTGLLIYAWSGDDVDLLLSGLHLSDNVFSVDAPYGQVSALVDTDWADLSDVVMWNNAMEAQGDDDRAYASSLLSVSNGQLSHIDLRGNTIESSGSASPLVGVYGEEADATLNNFIIAGNRVEAGGLYGALDLGAYDGGILTARNGDIVGNFFTGDADFGVMGVSSGDETDLALVSGVQVIANVYDGEGELSAVASWGEDNVTLAYGNLFDNTSDETPWGDVTGSDGNISADPLYTDVSDTDPTAWDLSLRSGSPAIDAGDPDDEDPDGSAADMGAYGGAGGASW